MSMVCVIKKHNWIWAILIFVMFFTSSLFFLEPQTVYAQVVAPVPGDPSTQEDGGGSGVFPSWDDLIGGALSTITGIFEEMAGWALGATGILFDVAIEYSLNSENFKNGAVSTGWSVFRDVANMTFIFILVYIAFAAILQLGGSYQRMLITLVIVAVLVNFSFFLTGLVVDAANILAAFLYNILTDNGTIGLAAQFRDGIEITSLLSPEAFNGLNAEAVYHIFAAIFLLIATFVFLSSAILFIARTVALMFILVLSPLAFVAAILDKTQHYWKDWLHKLISYSFVAPMYLLLIFMVLAVIKGGQARQSAIDLQDLGPAFAANETLASGIGYAGTLGYSFANYSGIVMFFALIIGLLIASLVVSRKMADGLATISVKYAGKAIGAAAGGAAFGLRNTAGRGLRAARDSKWVGSMVKSDSAVMRAAGRMTRGAADYGATARFDARSGVVGSAVGATAGGALGMGGVRVQAGRPGGKGGFEATRQASVRAATERTKANIAAAEKVAERKEAGAAQQKASTAAYESAQRDEAVEQQEKAAEKAHKKHLETAKKQARDQQIKDSETRTTMLTGAVSAVVGATAANKEAAEMLRGKRGEYKEPSGGLSSEDIGKIARAVKDSE